MSSVSIIVPSIRTHSLERFAATIDKACKNHEWELVVASPFDLPPSLVNRKNVKLVKDCGNVSRATQLAVLSASHPICYITVDDCRLIEDSLDKALEVFLDYGGLKVENKILLNARYNENNTQYPLSYWFAGSHSDLLLNGISPNWAISLQPIFNTQYFEELGGLDCIYEYSVFSILDFIFRAQLDGATVIHSPTECSDADYEENVKGTHSPVHHGQLYHDYPIFKEEWSQWEHDIHIPLLNWKDAPEVWERRFPKNQVPASFDEMMEVTSNLWSKKV